MNALKSNALASEENPFLPLAEPAEGEHINDPPPESADLKWWKSSWSLFRAVLSVKENLQLPREHCPSSAPLAREEWENLVQKDWIR